MEDVQSQDYYGPYFISFGEFFSKIIDAEYFYGLSKSENRLLLKFANSMDRSKYRIHLGEIKEHKLETWARLCKVEESHMSRTFKDLRDLQVIDVVKIGRRNHHVLHHRFIQALLKGMTIIDRVKPEKKKKNTQADVDKNLDSYQTGQLIVTKPGNSQLPNRVTHSYQTGQVALIEEIPSLKSLPNLSPPRSIPPDPQVVKTVDKIGDENPHLNRLMKYCRKEVGEAFLHKIRNRDQGYVLSFINYLGTTRLTTLDASSLDKTWVLWDVTQFTEQKVDFKDFGSQELN